MTNKVLFILDMHKNEATTGIDGKGLAHRIENSIWNLYNLCDNCGSEHREN